MLISARRIISVSAAFFATLHCDVAQAAWPSDPTVNVRLCLDSADRQDPTIVADGAGGAIITWQDNRNGPDLDIFAQRINAGGTPQWTADGVALCTAANNQQNPTIISDGAGGAIVTWHDARGGTNFDIYAQRLNAAGV